MGNINIPNFFRQATGNQFNGSPAYLESLLSTFRNDQASGMIEIQTSETQQVILIFAGGIAAGVYRLGPGTCQPISAADIALDWGRSEVPIRSVNLPDMAGRAVWLALESKPQAGQEAREENEWDRFLSSCKSEKWTGLAGIESDYCDGFLFLKEGNPVSAEAIFSTANGFQTSLAAIQSRMNIPWKLTLYNSPPASQAYQCSLLRLGAVNWGDHILNRYQEMVGQKLLQTMNNELNTLLQPWQWKIRLANVNILDQHFFPKLGMAAQAYLALFLSMGEQINIVLGNILAQRLLSETFGQINGDERALLETQRLIPAAFI